MTEELFPGNVNAQNKLRKAIEELRRSYYSSSKLSKIVSVKDGTPEDEGFLYMNFRYYIPEEWFTSNDIGFQHIFTQFGGEITLSEEKYLVDYIFKEESILKVEVGDNIVNDFVENFKKFSESNKIHAIFAPINQYVNMHTDWPTKTTDIQVDFTTGELSFCNSKPFIFWSNKYTPFDDFVFINRNFAEWIFKPSFKERLEIKVSKSDKIDKLDLIFFIKMKFKIVNSERSLILHRHVRTK
jgi:hypothetical protein